MRLWHESLIHKLPRQQLLGQWRECIALLGKGWGKKHSVVNYVFNYDRNRLANYAELIAFEMVDRGYNPNIGLIEKHLTGPIFDSPLYKEHNDGYLKECVENLKGKGIVV